MTINQRQLHGCLWCVLGLAQVGADSNCRKKTGVWCGVFLGNQKRGGTTLRSNVYRLFVSREQAPKAQYPLIISFN